MPESITCPYCSGPAAFVDSECVYGGRSYGMIYLCKDCFNAMNKNRVRNETPKSRRKRNIKARYGLDDADIAAMLDTQNGVCAICQKPMARVCVDHCHSTGKVRGLLCHGCNIKLPAVDNPKYLKSALRYLKSFGVLESKQ